MEEFNIQGKQTSFYKYCPGTFGYTLVLQAKRYNAKTTGAGGGKEEKYNDMDLSS